MSNSSCTFCHIVARRTAAYIVWEDADHVAFLDHQPVAVGHVLLIPRWHVPTIYDLTPHAYAHLFARARALAAPVAAAAGAPRTGLAVEGFGVPHAHVHLVPIWRGGDLDPCRQRPTTTAELQAAANRLKAVLGAAAG